MKIYHNPRCAKSRAGMQRLQEKGFIFEIVLYLKDAPFTVESLTALLAKMGKSPEEMIRKQETAYKKEIKGKELSDTELIEIMVANPKLINRPIIENDKTAVWGDPVSEIDKMLS